MSAHAVLAPSSAAIRVECSGSRALEAQFPEAEDSQESRDGTAAHWGAKELLHGRMIDTGQIAENGVMLTDEMVDAAEMYAEHVASILPEFAGYPQYIEQPVSIATIHPECWGTPDHWVYKPGKLVVHDFKFGHRYVEVFENWQLLEYVAGILDLVGVNGVTDEHTEVVMYIVQPRCYVGGSPIREWRTKAVHLRSAFNHLRNREEAAMRPDALCTPNPHCRDCRGRHACRALQAAGYEGMQYAESSIPFSLDPAALGVELRYLDRALKALEARRTGLAEQALSLIRSGKSVPWYNVAATQGRTRWIRPNAEVLVIGDAMGINLRKDVLLTPNQALDKGLDPKLVAGFSETPNGELKLIPDDGTKARKVFYQM